MRGALTDQIVPPLRSFLRFVLLIISIRHFLVMVLSAALIKVQTNYIYTLEYKLRWQGSKATLRATHPLAKCEHHFRSEDLVQQKLENENIE